MSRNAQSGWYAFGYATGLAYGAYRYEGLPAALVRGVVSGLSAWCLMWAFNNLRITRKPENSHAE